MHCPFCNEPETKVVDSRLVADGQQVRRRRQCYNCDARFTSYESAELVMPKIVKQDGTREPYSAEKLRAGMMRALEKRPVAMDTIETAIKRVEHDLRARGDREVQSRIVGEAVMQELKQMDQVAYVRFASVYMSFQDITEFRAEIERLENPGE